jgi:hypothetical protein
LVVFLRVLPWQEDEHAASIGETVAGMVAGGGGFAFFRLPSSPGEICAFA